MKHNMKLVILIKRLEETIQHKEELNFYKKYLSSKEYEYLIKNSIKKNIESYSSYKAIFKSKVAVGNTSTLLREKLCSGGKILSCNLTPSNLWDFPGKGICKINHCSYSQFEKRLLSIYSMSKKNYLKKVYKGKDYTCEYNTKISAIEIIKRKIDYFLSNKYLTKLNKAF